jgi:release factor glutamine methyltransferase
LNVTAYQKIILPLLQENFDEREAGNLFKYVLEEYFQKRFLDVQTYELKEEEIEQLTAVFQKIADHYPVQYIFKEADFYGLKLYVDENVLIPRPETEELVHWILEENKNEQLTVLDIGTGSGCIAIALKKKQPSWKVMALDVSENALNVARKNAFDQNVEIQFFEGDILKESTIVNRELNIIISNPPYIAYSEQDQMSASAILFEPQIALFVDHEDPLLFYDHIADFALSHLSSGSKLYFELNEFNAPQVQELLEKKGFVDAVIKKDLAYKERMLRCVKP